MGSKFLVRQRQFCSFKQIKQLELQERTKEVLAEIDNGVNDTNIINRIYKGVGKWYQKVRTPAHLMGIMIHY